MTSGTETEIRGSSLLQAAALRPLGMFQQAFDLGHRRRFGDQPGYPQGCQIPTQPGCNRMITGNECHRGLIAAPAQFPHQSGAIEARQIDIDEGEMERAMLCPLEAAQHFHGVGEDLNQVSAIGK